MKTLCTIAKTDDRQIQTVLDQALRDSIDQLQKDRPRAKVMTSFDQSVEEFDSLYRGLAQECS